MNKNVLYVLVLLGAGFYYGYDTFYPEYVAWETEITDLQKNIEQARQTAPKLADITKEEEELQERLSASLEKLPSGAELDNLLAMVTPILEGVGIQSSQIGQKNVDAASEQSIYRIHPIRITEIRNLSMATVVRLLHQLRNFHRIINVKSFDISRISEDDYTLNLQLETYSYIAAEGEELPPPRATPAPAEIPVTPAVVASDTVVAPEAPVEDDAATESPAAAPRAGATPRADTGAARADTGAARAGGDTGSRARQDSGARAAGGAR